MAQRHLQYTTWSKREVVEALLGASCLKRMPASWRKAPVDCWHRLSRLTILTWKNHWSPWQVAMSWSLIQSSLNLTTATAGGLFLSSMDSVRVCHEAMAPLSFSAKGQQTASEFYDQGILLKRSQWSCPVSSSTLPALHKDRCHCRSPAWRFVNMNVSSMGPWWFVNVYHDFHGYHWYHGLPMFTIPIIDFIISDPSWLLSSDCHGLVGFWIPDDPWLSLWPRRRRLSSSPSAPPARPISHRPSRRRLRTAFRLEPPHPMGQRHRKRRTTLVTIDDRFKDRCLEYHRISKVNS